MICNISFSSSQSVLSAKLAKRPYMPELIREKGAWDAKVWLSSKMCKRPRLVGWHTTAHYCLLVLMANQSTTLFDIWLAHISRLAQL